MSLHGETKKKAHAKPPLLLLLLKMAVAARPTLQLVKHVQTQSITDAQALWC